jgi:hypothetical protein
MLPAHLNEIVPFEVRQGQKFNINRFLGDGNDSNGDLVPDDYVEAGSGTEPAWLAGSGAPQSFQGALAWHVNDTDVDGNGIGTSDLVLARHLYARHLFCLLMLLWDEGYPLPFATETPVLSLADQRELTIRKLAQFAINVVDFRDEDAIMTPFEYDVNPFNGWDVDGNVYTNASSMPADGVNQLSGQDERRVVFGAEFPDVVLTEAKAMHDRRIRDTRYDPTLKDRDGGDPHPDQFRIPLGSLFVELYCPRNKYANNQRLPQNLYGFNSLGQPALLLGKTAPPTPADGVARPVWRLAISEHTTSGAANTPWMRQTSNRDSTSFDPDNMSLLPGAPVQLPIERYVWFSAQDPTAGVEMGRTFVNYLGWDVSLEPGQYAVVGPRPLTYIGSADDLDPTTIWDGNSKQGIALSQRTAMNLNGVVVTDLTGATAVTPGTQVKNMVGIVCDMAPPATWLDQTKRRGLNVTEPVQAIHGFYYGEPQFPNEAYDDLTTPTNVLPDEPYDQQVGYPLQQFSMLPTLTYENERAIFLQRLANPNLPWDPIGNPYVTVDWASTDVTVFSGEDDTSVQTPMMNDKDPVDPTPTPNPPDQLRFGTRQKGVPHGSPTDVNLWTTSWARPLTTTKSLPPALPPNPIFSYDLADTFGYLNTNLGTPQGPPNLGDPAEGPFPWLAHLDRPLMSPMELLMVPAWSQARLMHEFQPMVQPGTPRPTVNPYNQTAMNFGPVFTQLLNFFQTGNPNAMPTKISPQLTRLFDYVEVPCPFSGTEKWFNPGNTNGHFGDPSPAASATVASMYRPPFNKMSRFADPGKININTIYDDAVLEAALGSFPYPGNAAANRTFREQVILSRQGYGATGGAALAMDYRYPTRFANPFRPADTADLMPDVADMRRLAPAEATLLRSDYFMNTAANPPPGPVPTPVPSGKPLFDVPPNPIYNYNDPNRNPYFEYQAFQKIGNVFSTQSNVYAVWITTGYFEVEPNPPTLANPSGVDVAHPDGYRLGQEVGADSGNTVRHRSFFIIDRTRPVAYEPGKRHNTDKAVLLRRFIE